MAVRIYKPARNAMQSGKGKSDYWLLENVADHRRTADPLMGWTSTSDTETQVRLKFASREEAEAYARKRGLAYTVQPEAPVKLQKKSYAENFRFGRTTLWTH
mgnify:FL=1